MFVVMGVYVVLFVDLKWLYGRDLQFIIGVKMELRVY